MLLTIGHYSFKNFQESVDTSGLGMNLNSVGCRLEARVLDVVAVQSLAHRTGCESQRPTPTSCWEGNAADCVSAYYQLAGMKLG